MNTILLFALGHVTLSRRLSERASLTDRCTQWGAIASIVCPELIQGDIRGACSVCPSVVRSVQNVCYASFPGDLCSGDCDAMPVPLLCETPDCQNCWNMSISCQNCPVGCFTHAHCFDPDTQTFSNPPERLNEVVIDDCTGLRREYNAHGCCSNTNASFVNSSLYIRIR
jgi:hypothetical protein